METTSNPERARISSGPFPPVAHHVFDSERAGARRMARDGDGLPLLKIKVTAVLPALHRPRDNFATGLPALHKPRDAIPLPSADFPCPSRISGGFRMAHIGRPILRQRHRCKHPGPDPRLPVAAPRMQDAKRFPILSTPNRRRLHSSRPSYPPASMNARYSEFVIL